MKITAKEKEIATRFSKIATHFSFSLAVIFIIRLFSTSTFRVPTFYNFLKFFLLLTVSVYIKQFGNAVWSVFL